MLLNVLNKMIILKKNINNQIQKFYKNLILNKNLLKVDNLLIKYNQFLNNKILFKTFKHQIIFNQKLIQFKIFNLLNKMDKYKS